MTLKKGDFLFSEGQKPEGVFCIHEGHVKTFKNGSDGKEQIIHLAKAGDLVGWQHILCEDPYSASTMALDKVSASHFSNDVFIDVIKKNCLSVELTRYLCNYVLMLEGKILELSQKSVRERLATNILMLHEKFGARHGNHILITIPLTRGDFANLIATNTETVIKLLSELRKEGHIDFIDKKILILNLNALKKFSDFYG
ncbi:MAG: Crp/Fnr family transcriptional regulator, partial [Cytophagaceae bacterium]